MTHIMLSPPHEGAALAGFRVVELASMACAPFCARLLGALGAEVVKVEHPGFGDDARRRPPFAKDVPGPGRSLLHLYVNHGKHSVTLNLTTAAGLTLFRELVATADVVVSDWTPARFAEHHIAPAELMEQHPELTWVSVTPYGAEGVDVEAASAPLTVQAASGSLYLQPTGWLNAPYFGDRSPVRWGASSSDFLTAVQAASGTVAALISRERDGRGLHVDVSEQEALMHFVRHDIDQYPHDGTVRQRAGGAVAATSPAVPINGTMRCKDGYVAFWPLEPYMLERTVQLMGTPEWSQTDWFKDPFERQSHGAEIRAAFEEWIAQFTMAELYELAAENNLALSPVLEPEGVAAAPQLHAREFFVKAEREDVGAFELPWLPFRLDDAWQDEQRPAPELGQDTEVVLSRLLGHSDQEIAQWFATRVI